MANLMLMHPSVKLFLKNGEKFSGGIILQNTASVPLKINAVLADTLDKDMKPIARACAGWIELEETDFVIPANGFKELKYKLTVPDNARGGYWTAIVYSYDAGKMAAPGNMNVGIRMHIESPINISIMDSIEDDIKASSIMPSYEDGQVKISATIKDTGNTFEDITSYFMVYNGSGKQVLSLKCPATKIYPDNEKAIEVTSATKLASGSYKVICLFDYGYGKLKTEEKALIVK